MIINVLQNVVLSCHVDILAIPVVATAIPELTVALWRRPILHARLLVEDHIQHADTVAQVRVMVTHLVRCADDLAKSAALIRGVARNAMSLVYLALRTVHGHVHILESALYLARCLVIFYHALNDVPTF